MTNRSRLPERFDKTYSLKKGCRVYGFPPVPAFNLMPFKGTQGENKKLIKKK
jgi:hypothetical protein